MTRVLVEAPRWLLVACLIFAPWAYGSTRPWAIQVLSILLGTVCLLWLSECVVRRRRPHLPLVPLVAVLALVIQGWWMALNATWVYDAAAEMFIKRTPFSNSLPGSLDQTATASAMFTYTALLGVFLFCCDLFQRPAWRKRIWVAFALAGFSIALFGIILKIGGLPALALIWEPEKRDLANNFATFRYRANAGAYLNLILPMLTGLAFLTFQKAGRSGAKAFWVAAVIILALAIQVNPSRASWAIAILIALSLAIRISWSCWREHAGNFQPKLGWLYAAIAGVLFLSIAGISLLGGWETSWHRLGKQGFDPSGRSPNEIYRAMIPDAPWFGFGPGTFATAFPAYQQNYDFAGREVPSFWVNGIWLHAHQDYLQTLIEWGGVGAFGWALLVGGGLVRAVVLSCRRRSELALKWLLFCVALALAGTLIHSLIDFPLQVASIQLLVCVLLGMAWAPVIRNQVGGECLAITI